VRLLLVVNVSASAVTPRTRVVIAKALAADHKLEVVETDRRGHATHLAHEAATEGWDAVVVLGGDGTVNEAANGLVGTDTALGVLPGGSTNVFARTIGASTDPIEATGQLLASLAGGERRRIGMGRADERYFLFHLGVGFDAAVIDRVERRHILKRYAGHPLFVAAAVDTWVRHYDRSRPRFSVSVPGPDPAGEAADSLEGGYFAVFLNSDPYTFLGTRPLHLGPGTGPDDGLAVVAFRSLRLTDLLGTAARALGSGRRVGRPHRIWALDHLEEAEVTGLSGPDGDPAGAAFPYQVDGDFLGLTSALRVSHHPAVIDVLYPPGS